MPNFKPKANKKIKVSGNSILTLDNQHSNKMKEFHNIEYKEIPLLKTQKKYLIVVYILMVHLVKILKKDFLNLSVSITQ